MTLLQLIEQTGTIPNRFTTTAGHTMEYETGVMASGAHMAMYWEIVNGKKHHLWAIRYGDTEAEAKELLKQTIIKDGKYL
jgi:hypothetical protein